MNVVGEKMKIGHRLTNAIGARSPDNLYCAIINLKCFLRGWPFRLSKSDVSGLYIGTDKKDTIFIARRNRYKRHSKNGILYSTDQLAKSYCLNHVDLKKDDVVIDCGANIGEIGMWAKQFGVRYIPFEPEDAEADCSDLNNFKANKNTQRNALWYEKTTLKFYSKPDSADSSAIEINDYSEVKRIEAVTLNDFVKAEKIKKVKLLKLEAEGAEPEILQGALKILKHIEYIAVDCGYERGKSQDATFNEVNEILVENGFYIVVANLKRPTFLYRRSV